jgi:hypothetical protein
VPKAFVDDTNAIRVSKRATRERGDIAMIVVEWIEDCVEQGGENANVTV